MVNIQLTGSNLTRAMLSRDRKPVWCAVADYSDEEAIDNMMGNDFTALIVSCDEDNFFCSSGMEWSFAVPIKIVAMTESDVDLGYSDWLARY